MLSAAIEGMFLNSELFDHQRGASNKGYKKIDMGTLVLSTQNLHLGNANVNLRFEHGMVSPAYKTYHIHDCSIKLIAELVKSDKAKRFFYNATTVGASVCRRNVEWDTLYDQPLYLPSSIEQECLATFLSALSSRINKQTELVEHLKKYKRGLSESIFSTLSCPTQELSDVCNIVGGGTPDTGILEYWNGDISWFTPTEVGKKKYVISSSRKITEEGLCKSSAKILPPDTVLLTSRATLGEMSLTTATCCTNQGFQSLVAKKDVVLPEYLYYLQTIIKPWCEKYSSGNTFREISKKALGKCTIPVPSIMKQKYIVDCLSLIDSKIEKSESVLEKLLRLKSALLQQLYI